MQKILIVVLILILLNLGWRYLRQIPEGVEYGLSIASTEISAEEPAKGWDYYKGSFDARDKPNVIADAEREFHLVLRGTVISSAKRSFAVIEDLSSGIQGLYRLGDSIGAVRLVAMDRERVLVEYNGTNKSLSMSSARSARSARENPAADSIHREQPVDFADLMTKLRIKPYFEGSECVGFQISNIKSDLVQKMGFENGDIIKSINGIQMNDPLKALEIIYKIELNKPVRFGVKRMDEKLDINCVLEG